MLNRYRRLTCIPPKRLGTRLAPVREVQVIEGRNIKSTSMPVLYFLSIGEPSSQLSELADKVRDNDLSEGIEREHVLLDIAQHGRRRDLRQVISWVVEWTGHEGKYRPALDESSRRIRKAFRTLFDHSRGPDSRLRDLDTNGECKIKGFGLASLTMILHWKFPREYPPFNRRTKRFLKDFEFEEFVPKTLSPTQYAKWIAFAQELSERLQLPSAGHIDRIVWEYTQDLDMEL